MANCFVFLEPCDENGQPLIIFEKKFSMSVPPETTLVELLDKALANAKTIHQPNYVIHRTQIFNAAFDNFEDITKNVENVIVEDQQRYKFVLKRNVVRKSL